MTEITANFTLTVAPAAAPLSITPQGGMLPSEIQGVEDKGEQIAVVSGGTPPYNISVTAGTVPPGMQVSTQQNPDGSVAVFLEGTPTQPGAFSFTVTVADSAGASASVKTQSGTPSTAQS
jgi:hypothetical protein